MSPAKCSADGHSEMMSETEVMGSHATHVASPRQHLCSAAFGYGYRMTFVTRLRWAMNRASVTTAAELARRTRGQVGESTAASYLRETRAPKGASLRALAKALSVNPVWLDTGEGTPELVLSAGEEVEREVIGYVGAGGEAVFEPVPIGTIRLMSSSDTTVAVQIRGDSLGHGFDGWYAVYDNVQNPVTDALSARLCVVGTSDGRTLIKWIYATGKTHMLVSGTGANERGVKLAWGAEVLSLQPYSSPR